jgi:ATP-dependent DNA helicase RecG
MRKSNDGFEIAQKDLELRGPGDFFGIRQSGMPEFKLANLLTDNLVLEQTQEAVKKIMEEDPKLEKVENLKIKRALYEKYGEQLNNIVG